MFGYKIFLGEEIVSCNKGYENENEAKEFAKKDAEYFNNDENIRIETFKE